MQNDSIFAASNKYGYKININHPKIKPLYERYKLSNLQLMTVKEHAALHMKERQNKRRNDISTT